MGLIIAVTTGLVVTYAFAADDMGGANNAPAEIQSAPAGTSNAGTSNGATPGANGSSANPNNADSPANTPDNAANNGNTNDSDKSGAANNANGDPAEFGSNRPGDDTDRQQSVGAGAAGGQEDAPQHGDVRVTMSKWCRRRWPIAARTSRSMVSGARKTVRASKTSRRPMV